MKPTKISLAILLPAIACAPDRTPDLDAAHALALRDSVMEVARQISADLAADGPIAWLRYFETGPAFLMATDGRIVFPSSDSARVFVEYLSRHLSAVDLDWLDLRVEPLAPGVAALAASYRETITYTAGNDTTFGGYVTGVARHTEGGWRLQHLHWSSPVPSPP
ncbi:MAG: nuclear transport factor 2 family protein [Gemmatimonadales bacterium]